jgi:hypothetical protein
MSSAVTRTRRMASLVRTSVRMRGVDYRLETIASYLAHGHPRQRALYKKPSRSSPRRCSSRSRQKQELLGLKTNRSVFGHAGMARAATRAMRMVL